MTTFKRGNISRLASIGVTTRLSEVVIKGVAPLLRGLDRGNKFDNSY
jgi:hypothetical protein